METKTLFQYQGKISSRDLSEALGISHGMGPLMGFSRVDLNTLKVYSQLINPSDTVNPSRVEYFSELFNNPSITHKVGTITPTFGLITRTGHLYSTDASELPITLMNSSSGRSELVLWALYQPIDQPINNVPTIVGYWNTGNFSFYDNLYAPLIQDSKFELGSDINPDPSITFNTLYDKAISILPNGVQMDNLTLIGVYGKGSNPITGTLEDFSIVPYGGQYPYSKPFLPNTFNKFQQAINKISSFLGETTYNNLGDYVKSLLPTPQTTTSVDGTTPDNTLVGVPIGTILMWAGGTVPQGWQICDGTNGTPDLRDRVPIGYGSKYGNISEKGGTDSVTLSEGNLPKHRHEMKRRNLKWGDNADERPFYNFGESTPELSAYTEYAGKDNPDPIKILPPYTVVQFIMRIA